MGTAQIADFRHEGETIAQTIERARDLKRVDEKERTIEIAFCVECGQPPPCDKTKEHLGEVKCTAMRFG